MMTGYIPQLRAYTVGVLTSQMVGNRPSGALTMFDADWTPILVMIYSGGTLGNTIETWFSALHTTKGLGVWYQVFVALLGIVIAMFSVTGVYLWWKKRRMRKQRKAQVRSSVAPAVA